MKRVRAGSILAVLLAIVLLAAACGDDKDDTSAKSSSDGTSATTQAGPKGEPIKIGALLSSTGLYASGDGLALEGARLAVKEINAAGGIKGRPLALDVGDYQSLVENAATVAQKLINDDHVAAIIGPNSTTIATAVEPVVQTASIVMVSGAGANPTNPWHFATFPLGGTEKLVPDFMAKEGATDHFCRMRFPGPTADVGDKVIYPAFKANGLVVAASADAQPNTVDFTPQISKLKSEGCKAVWYEASGGGVAQAARAMSNLKMDAILATHGSNASPDIAKALGDNAKFTYFYGPKILVADDIQSSDPDYKTVTDFVKAFRNEYHKDPLTDSGKGYTMVQTVAEAMKAVGVDGKAMRDWIETATIQSPLATYVRSAKDHNGVSKPGWAVIIQWDNATSKWHKVFP